jgi:hypothetical protein
MKMGAMAIARLGGLCVVGVLLAGVLAFPTWAEEADKPTVVPVKKAPFHLFTFEDENMALENVTLPPGRSTSYHSHDQDLVFVITAGAKITNQVLGKEPTELEFKLGEVRFAPYTKTPGVHQIANLERIRRCGCWRLRSFIRSRGAIPYRTGPQNMRSLSTTIVFAPGGSSSILVKALPQSSNQLQARDLLSPEGPSPKSEPESQISRWYCRTTISWPSRPKNGVLRTSTS